MIYSTYVIIYLRRLPWISHHPEDVVIRYDPADLAEIWVFYHDRFLCRAICPELAGQTASLKEIEKARAERRKQIKAGLSTRQALVEQFLAVHQQETLKPDQNLIRSNNRRET